MSTRRIALAVALAILAPARTSAAGTRAVYIDEVAVFGGADAARARALVAATVTRGGVRAQFAELATEPCGNDPACLMTRTRSAGAVIGLRFTVAEIAGTFVVGVLIVDLERRDTRREILEGIDLTRTDNRLVGALQLRPDGQRPPR